jgi:hypothetical protein
MRCLPVYKFTANCKICGRPHAHFSCTSDLKSAAVDSCKSNNSNKYSKHKVHKTDNEGAEEVRGSDTNVVEYNVMPTSSSGNILIPTFTLQLPRINSKKLLNTRAMYDPASQVSFISETVAEKLSCRVVKTNIDIRITGFNESKLFNTSIVELSAKLNNKTRKFHVVIVPKIKTKIKCTNLEPVCRQFRKELICLVDKNLDTDDGTVDILLGDYILDQIHILPVQSCSFGVSNKLSLLYYTCTGIMLAGDVGTLLNNINNLHLLKSFIKKFNSVLWLEANTNMSFQALSDIGYEIENANLERATVRHVKIWNSLLCAVVESTSASRFKASLADFWVICCLSFESWGPLFCCVAEFCSVAVCFLRPMVRSHSSLFLVCI